MKTKFTFMKTIAAAVVSLVLTSQVNAQSVMYGVASSGGTNGVGTVFSFTNGGSLSVIANMNDTYAAVPEGGVLLASDGNLYGSSYEGGWDDSCTIWGCSPVGGGGNINTIINLYSIWGASDPEGNGLIQASDGNLYGMTTIGNGAGVIFQLQLSGSYSLLHSFTGTDGRAPYGSLIQAPDGTLWGMTSSGGAYSLGNIFTCTTTGVVTSVYSFASLDGTNAHGDLLLANDGNFYGMTYSGGKYGYGTIFRYSPSGTFTKLVDFNDTLGANPYGSLIQASDGRLYGLTSRGGNINSGGYGTLFQCSLSGELTTLMQFDGANNGSNPEGSLMQASDGNFYGVTYSGGMYAGGTIFEYSQTHIYTKLYDLNTTTGTLPMYEKLIEGSNVSTNVNKVSNANDSKLYPNPNNGQFTINLASAGVQSSLEVYNEIGEKVYAGILSNSKGNTAVNVGSQPNGVYLYRVIDENGKTISNGNFVIQK